MLLDLRSLLEAAEGTHAGTHTATAAVATSSATGQVIPAVTVFPGVTGGMRVSLEEIPEITARGVAVAAPSTARASGRLLFAAGALQSEAPARAASQATQGVEGHVQAQSPPPSSVGTTSLGFRARRISAGSGRPSAAAGLSQVRLVGSAEIQSPSPAATAAGTQRTNGLTRSAAPAATTLAVAGVRTNGLQKAMGLPATAAAEARIRYPRRLGDVRAVPPHVLAMAAGRVIAVVSGTATMRAETAGARASARRIFRPDPVALWALGIADDDSLAKAS